VVVDAATTVYAIGGILRRIAARRREGRAGPVVPAYRPDVRRGVCDRCGAATVRAARNGVDTGQTGVTAVLRPDIPPDFRGVVKTHRADLYAYCCTSCGYVELHLPRQEDLAFVAQTWTPVPVVGEEPS